MRTLVHVVLPVSQRSRRAAMLPLAALALFTSACLGYPTEGTVATPPPPGSESGASRLPELVGQLQSGQAGLSLFDGSTNDVLAETDATPSGKDGQAAPSPTQTVAGASTPGPASTPTPTPGSLGLQPGTVTPSPTPTTTSTGSETPSPTPTPTPTETPTPTSAPPAEGSPPSEAGDGSGGGEAPPSEAEG